MDHMCTISFHTYSFPVAPQAIHLIYNDRSQAALTPPPPPRMFFLLLSKLWPDSLERLRAASAALIQQTPAEGTAAPFSLVAGSTFGSWHSDAEEGAAMNESSQHLFSCYT